MLIARMTASKKMQLRPAHSAFTPVFRELLSNHPYHEILSSEFFNIELIDSIVDRYVAGEEIVGEDLNILFPLCFLSLIGWY